MASMINLLRKLKISSRLMFGYIILFLLVLNGANLIHYLTVRNLLQTQIERELQLITESITNSIHTTANTTIHNYLRAITQTNLRFIEQQYKLVQQGKISEPEAKKIIADTLNKQKIGDSGYPYVVDSKGIIQVHPKEALIGKDLMQYPFMQQQTKQKKGYLEYDWKNPDESKQRAKALHMLYFEPWDWIVSSSSYRSEFLSLINIEDFQDYISSQKFGDTGYTYVLNSKGDLVLHPFISGNFYETEDSNGYKFVQDMLSRKNGAITYTWRNPQEQDYREKYALFQYIPDFDWYVVSSTYSEELFRPINKLSNIYLVVLGVSIVILVLCSVVLSRSIVEPLNRVMKSMQTAATGKYQTRIADSTSANDELSLLSRHFNNFMSELERSNSELHSQIEQTNLARKQQQELNRKLEKLNQNLENIVDERTNDLQESLAQLKETQEQLVESEKLAALGGLVAGVAHEVNTPLGVSVTATSLVHEVLDELTAAFNNQSLTKEKFSDLILQLSETASLLSINLQRAAKLISDFKLTAVEHVSEVHSAFNVSHLINTLIGGVQTEAQKIPVFIAAEVDSELMMDSLSGVLTEVISHLLVNSFCHAFPSEKLAELDTQDLAPTISIDAKQQGENIILSYQDNGIGVEDKLHQKIFEPFYKDKRDHEGAGLGLNLVYNLVKHKLSGQLLFESKPNQGVKFTLTLPRTLPA
ncbi:cache domain-containing protein [Vibrio marisflavi]|uniref:histidine kinase n=1 Tax=Vibrio marisflavi CECT 7928 TaxID=634439 RepID=A0ABN8E624_9VIBR|nr:cache domain-containing protein [Vibrio marisflavi]CAH0539647.1 Adaptive-response sensory-kinase SasA [Vibrio marisflavi CECT 7928]